MKSVCCSTFSPPDGDKHSLIITICTSTCSTSCSISVYSCSTLCSISVCSCSTLCSIGVYSCSTLCSIGVYSYSTSCSIGVYSCSTSCSIGVYSYRQWTTVRPSPPSYSSCHLSTWWTSLRKERLETGVSRYIGQPRNWNCCTMRYPSCGWRTQG